MGKVLVGVMLVGTTFLACGDEKVTSPVVSSGHGGADGSGGQPSPCCPTPPSVTAELFGVDSVGPNDVWAVGAQGTILHYDGCWRVEYSPTTAALTSVWASPGGTVWAVGAEGTILRREAGIWSTVPAPDNFSFTGVWGAADNDVWAVTAQTFVEPGRRPGVILHWDGAAWSVAFEFVEFNGFSSVWGSAPNDVWAVGGGFEPDGDYASPVLHWDGTTWTTAYTCNPQGSREASGGFVSRLVDVRGVAGGSVWSVGVCYAGFEPTGFVARGLADQRLIGGLAPLAEHRFLDAVWASSDSDVWAASATDGEFQGIFPTMLHFDGAAWTESSDLDTMGIRDLDGTSANDIWAVGTNGRRVHFDGTAWTPSP